MKKLLHHIKIFLLLSLLLLGLASCISQTNVKSGTKNTTDYQNYSISKPVKQAYWLDQPKVIAWQEAPKTWRDQRLFDWLAGELTVYKVNNRKAGLKQLTEIALEIDQADAYKRVASIAFFTKDNKTVYEMVTRWLLLEPDNEQARYMALNIELERLNLSLLDAKDKVYSHIDWLLKSSQVDLAQRFLDLATQLRQQRNPDLALEIMEEVLNKYSDDANAYTAYANLAIIFNKKEKAMQALERALAINSKQSNAIILQSQIRYKQGKKKTAIKQLKDAVRKDKKNPTLRKAYARMLISDKQYKKAGYQYEYLLEDSPSDESLLFTLGLLALDNEDYILSRKYFNRLLLVPIRQDEASYYLGRVSELEKKYQEAVSYYLSVYMGNYYAESRFRAAWSYAQLAQYDVAQKLLHSLREQKDPVVTLKSYVTEGQLLRQQKRYQEAFDLYSKAILLMPNNKELLYARSFVAGKLKKIDVVEQDLRDILKSEPDNVDVLNALGYSLLNLTNRYDEAFLLIKRALQMQPDSGPIMDSYGWALYRKGQYQEALIYLRKAYDISPDPEIGAHLGEVLWLIDQKQEAEAIWNSVLKIEPDNEVLLKTIDRLKK